MVWGALHGAYLAAERWLRARFGHSTIWQRWAPRVFLALLTYFLVNITWVFFRAQDFATAWRLIDTMLTWDLDGQRVLITMDLLIVPIVIGAMLMVHWFMRNRHLHEVVGSIPRWLIGVIWGVMLWLIIIAQGQSDAFIYFQF